MFIIDAQFMLPRNPSLASSSGKLFGVVLFVVLEVPISIKDDSLVYLQRLVVLFGDSVLCCFKFFG